MPEEARIDVLAGLERLNVGPLPSDPRCAAGAPGWAEVRARHLYTHHHRSLAKEGGLLLDDPP